MSNKFFDKLFNSGLALDVTVATLIEIRKQELLRLSQEQRLPMTSLNRTPFVKAIDQLLPALLYESETGQRDHELQQLRPSGQSEKSDV